jgi:hypothetical protein
VDEYVRPLEQREGHVFFWEEVPRWKSSRW